MIIYLYVKTHNKTGLKYLGKTTKKDSHKYFGSGIRWLNHLNKHGYDYTTDILRECHSEEELKEWGLYYSNLWNIVESKEWANLKTEEGQGGSGFHLSKAAKQKIVESRLKNGTMNTNTPTSIAKSLETRKKNNTLNTVTEESIKKRIETRKQNGKQKTTESKIQQWETRRNNDPDNLSGKRTRQTRIQNGSDKGWKRSAESNLKMIETKRLKKLAANLAAN